MSDIDSRLIEEITTKIACAGGPAASKKVQMDIAQAMQEWTAEEINERLAANAIDLKSKAKAHKYKGGWRGVSVDVHIQSHELGLVLAIDPKHLQSRNSITKNWKNMLNDLIAFAGNIHTRFPMCVVGGIVGFQKNQVDNSILNEMYSIVNRVATRALPSDQNSLLEAFGIVVYECDPSQLVPDIPPTTSPFRISNVFDRVVDVLIKRYIE